MVIVNQDKVKKSSGQHSGEQIWKQPSVKDGIGIMWDFVFASGRRKPDHKLPVQPANLDLFHLPETDQLNVTWLGHSSLMINIDGFRILTDPVFARKITPLGPTRYNGPVPVNVEKIGIVDVVLISHNHYDHLNRYSINLLRNKVKQFIVPRGLGTLLHKWGVDPSNIRELDWWQEYNFNEDLVFAATPAQHFSGRGLRDRNRTLWCSYVIKTPGHKIFFGADSGYFAGFRQIGAKYGPFDMTFLECGAYNENWHFVHMFPEETVQAHLDLGGRILQPIHWGTFNLALHDWDEPMRRLTTEAKIHQVRTSTPICGETVIYDRYIPTKEWWQYDKNGGQ